MANRLSPKTRKEIVEFANDLIEAGGTRDVVTEMVRKKFKMKNTMAAATCLSRNGVKFKEANRVTSVRRNAEQRANDQLEIASRRHSLFDPSSHLYYKAAAELVKKGYDATVKNGICMINGHKVPWRRFVVDMAKIELPQ